MSRRSAFAFIALLAVGMFARPLVRNEVFTFRDHTDYFQPLRYFTAVELRNFRLPLWNPYNASGEPWLANPQTAIFYPPFWIFLIVPFAQAYVLFLLLHVALLGCGAFLLFSRIASERAAFAATIALTICGPTLSMLDIQNTLTTFAWLPLILWCALARVSPMWSGAAIAMSFLAGEPFFAAVGAVMYVCVSSRAPNSTSAHRAGDSSPSARLGMTLDTALTAFCLSAIVLLPFLSMIAGSDRAGATAPEEILRDSMPLSDWLHLGWPSSITTQQFVPIVYVGIVPCLLAIAGVFTRKSWPWIALLAFAMVIASGKFLPPIGALLAHMPVTILRYPARVVPLAALAISALAAIGFDRITPRFGRFASVPLAVALIIVDLLPHVAPLLHSEPFNLHAVPYAVGIGRDGKIVRVNQPSRRFDRRAWVSGYLNLLDRRFDAWTAAPIVSRAYVNAYESALRDRAALDRMSVRYILEPAARGISVRQNSEAFPLAYFRSDRGNLSRPAVLAITTTAVFVIIDVASDGTLVVTQRDAPGWSVEVDHRAAPPQREGNFRAVRLAPGHHEIVWRYHPRAFEIGSALTILAIARMLLSKKFVKR